MKDHQNKYAPCPYCGIAAPLLWVHGHGQCAHCGTNCDECCRGEAASCSAEPIPASSSLNQS